MTRASHSEPSEPTSSTGPVTPVFPLVGLGASAGGIKALQTFFDALPSDSGMAFVVIMHLAPDHVSNLASIVQHRTSMPVLQVVEPTPVQPDHVYVIPPTKHLTLQDNQLHLVEPQQAMGKRLAIDLFFRTLAAAYGPRAIAIILSGTDSDGSIGIKHVKEQGGLTLAQAPEEAEFDSMPRGAIATGMVDWVLPVGEMPSRLLAFMDNEARMHVPPEAPQETPEEQAEQDTNSGGPLTIQQTPSTKDEAALVEVLRLVRLQTGHDFAYYKRATILRRVARRLQVNLLEDIPAYLTFLRSHPAEVTALLHDLLISVTNFFRDKDAFATLESHIPQLFADKTASDQVRVWVAGCATGEEAYSVAILLAEHAARLENPPAILVFATDLDEDVIAIARAGVYPATIEADVSEERLRRFFQQEKGGYRIKKELRERVLFSAHDVLQDSPFSRLDLVTCRNLLIYLKREAQEALFDLFHFALRPGSLLFLGSSENLGDSHALFAPLDKRYRLFVRRTVPRPNAPVPALSLSAASQTRLSTPVLPRFPIPARRSLPAVEANGGERRAPLFGDLHFTLLERFAPPSVVINSNHDLVHLSEHAGQFLQMAGGEVSTNLLKVVHPALRLELHTALFRAEREEAAVSRARVPLTLNGVPRLLTLHVRPAWSAEGKERFFLIVFELLPEDEQPAPRPPASETLLQHLEAELEHLKEQLSLSVEQHEASIEELKSANEELQAVNEEMRSTAEELETSKEELQSVNEELTTVNNELKGKVDELSRSNSDLQNLMASTEIGTIFLDRQLRIKRYTASAQEVFNLIPTDEGRPLSDLTHTLHYPQLTEDAQQVLRNLHRHEREVSSGGRWFLARILPYRTIEDYIDGVVLTFVDITARRRAEDELRESEARFRALSTASSDVIYRMNPDWTEMRLLNGGVFLADTLRPNQTWMEAYLFAEDQPRVWAAIQEAIQTKSVFALEHRVRRTDGTVGWTFSRAVPILNAEGAIVEWFGAASNITARKQAEEARLRLEREASVMEERHRVARELHDTLAQGFTGIRLQLDLAQSALEALPSEADEARQHVERGMEIAQDSYQEVVHSIRALRTPLLENVTLIQGLERLTQEMQDNGEVVFIMDGTPHPLSPIVEHDLYRIGQEALVNAVRYSRAQQITLSLTYFDEELHLSVLDNGCGFDPGTTRKGFGITGMQERAHRLGAELTLRSQPGQGTQVLLIYPAPPKQRQTTS